MEIKDPENKDMLWNEYKLHIELFNSYLSLCLKVNIFYYAVTCALLSFYFESDNTKFVFSLAYLFGLGAFLLCVFFETKSKIDIYGDYVVYIAKVIGVRFIHIKPRTLVQVAKTVIAIMIANLICLFILFVIHVRI